MAFNNTRLFLHSLLCCFALICLSSGFPTEESVLSSKAKQEFGIFKKWMKKHGKTYPNSKETEIRFQIFQKNLQYITEMNLKRSNSSSGHRLGLNKFADMSMEEFEKVYLHQQKMPTATETATATISSSDCAAPASMDWRNQGSVTPVKYQGQCGCCWAFAAVGAIESINAKTSGQLISLSEQQLLDCDTINQQGCSGGWSYLAFEWVINNGGITEETSYPYVGQQGSCMANMQNGGSVVKINSYTQIAKSDEALLCAVAQQPVAVSFYVTEDFKQYKGGIYKGENCPQDPSLINHAFLVVGYDSENGIDYWIIKNSWGADWGSNGYGYVQRNKDSSYGVCSISAWGYVPNI